MEAFINTLMPQTKKWTSKDLFLLSLILGFLNDISLSTFIYFKRKSVFVTNSDVLILILLQPNVVDKFSYVYLKNTNMIK